MTSKASNMFSLMGKVAASAATVFVAHKIFSATSKKPNLDLRGKIVLITGGSRGFGLALAHEFGRQGAIVALCARNEAELAHATARLRQEQIEAHSFDCDITQPAEVTSLVQKVAGQFGRIDVLINDAGYIKVGPFDSFDHAEYERAMELMFWAPVNLTLAVLPHMEKQKSGYVVNISSVGGRVSVPHLLPYSCAKFALTGFSTGLSSEAKSKNIHVLTVWPGLMRTGSYLNAEFTGDAENEFAWFGILGNLPGFSVAADYAAGAVREALENHRYSCTISLPAQLLIATDSLLPEASRSMLALMNQLLPSADWSNSKMGKMLNPNLGKIFQAFTSLGRRAAGELNE